MPTSPRTKNTNNIEKKLNMIDATFDSSNNLNEIDISDMNLIYMIFTRLKFGDDENSKFSLTEMIESPLFEIIRQKCIDNINKIHPETKFI